MDYESAIRFFARLHDKIVETIGFYPKTWLPENARKLVYAVLSHEELCTLVEAASFLGYRSQLEVEAELARRASWYDVC